MKQYIVLYRIDSYQSPLTSPFGFACWADSTDHAEEQCIDAYPTCNISWIYEGDSYEKALASFWYD